MILAVAIAALVSLGLAHWLRYRQDNDPWRNAVRYSSIHEARAEEHLEAARLYPETAEDHLRNARAEKKFARDFRLEVDRLKP